MIDSLRSRGKILGMAMGEVVLAQIEENQIPVCSYLADLTPIVEKLDEVCYNFLEKPPYS